MADVKIPSGFLDLKIDHKRFTYLKICHTVDGLAYIIRLILICVDISGASQQIQSTLGTFLGIIFLLDFIGGFCPLLCNLMHAILTYIIPILYETDSDDIPYFPRYKLLHFSTLTCFPCESQENPLHSTLLARFITVVIFQVLRFTAFILSAFCANRYPPFCLGFAIMAGISLVLIIPILVLEYFHYWRVRTYFPYATQNVARDSGKPIILPYSLLNDERTTSWNTSLCKNHKYCRSRDLLHVLMYHSGSQQYRRDDGKMIGFHQTSPNSVLKIYETEFQPSNHPNNMLGPGIYFATCLDHTQFKAQHFGAYIIALVDPGKSVHITKDRNDPIARNGSGTAVYFQHPQHKDEFCIRLPSQIKSWVVAVDQNETRVGQSDPDPKVVIIDKFDPDGYYGYNY